MIVDICSTVVVFPRNDGLIGSEFAMDLRIINPKTKIISLPITIVESQMGKYSREDNNRKAVSIKILSAAGSSILPSGVISFLLLARYPSTPSAILAIAKKTRAKPKAKRYNYYIQVVSCISQECVDESRLQLKNLGYEPQVRISNKNSKIPELITTKILDGEDSAKLVNKINKINPMAGHAFRKSVKNGFQISLGFFPDLKTANIVRTNLNQQFKDKLFFKIQSTIQKTKYKVVQIGGIKTKPEALKIRDQLKNNISDFQEAFVKTVVMR